MAATATTTSTRGEGVDWVEGQGGDDMIQSTEVNPAYDHIVGGTGKD